VCTGHSKSDIYYDWIAYIGMLYDRLLLTLFVPCLEEEEVGLGNVSQFPKLKKF